MKTNPTISALLLFACCTTPLLALENEPARRAQLQRLRGAITAYGLLYAGKAPARLSDLVNENLLDGPGSLVRPDTAAVPAHAELDARSDYTLEPLEGAKDMIVREKAPLAGETEVLVAFKGGSIKALPSGPATPPAEATTAKASTVGEAPPTVAPPPVAPRQVAPPAATPPETVTTPVTSTPAPVLNPNPKPPVRPAPPAPVLGVPAANRGTVATDLPSAQAAFEAGRIAEAQAGFAAVAQRNPKSIEAHLGLGRCANLIGDLDGALRHYLAVAPLAPETPNLRVWIAEIYLAQGQHRSATQWLETETKLQPRSAWAWSWLGTLQWERGEGAKARASIARAAALGQNVAAWRLNNGVNLLANNQAKRAKMDFNTLLLLDPRDARAHYYLGECQAQLGERDQAIESFRSYLQGEPTSDLAATARQRLEELRRPR